jgi:hypothetical protein
MCLHTILQDPNDANRLFTAISAAGAFRTDDGGETWLPINSGLLSNFELPDPNAEVGHCVHNIAMHPNRPGVLYMQKHWDVMRSDDSGDRGTRSVATCRPTSGSRSRCTPMSRRRSTSFPSRATRSTIRPDGKLRVYRSRTGGNEWEALTKGLPQSDCYVNVLRSAMAVDTLDECGIYFGTTGGQVYASADSGDNWQPIVRDLPAVLSVEVQTLL